MEEHVDLNSLDSQVSSMTAKQFIDVGNLPKEAAQFVVNHCKLKNYNYFGPGVDIHNQGRYFVTINYSSTSNLSEVQGVQNA
jgi:hypothetical protein